MCCNFKGTAGTGTGFFKYKSNLLSLTDTMRNACFLLCFQKLGKVNKTLDLISSEIKKLEKTFALGMP